MGTMFYQNAGEGRLRALIWKDYRANRLVLVVGAFLLLVPHAITVPLVWRGDITASSVGPGDRELSAMEIGLFKAGLFSLGFSCLTFALLGGNIIAGERIDGSAEFLGSLPPSRAKVLASKGILVLTAVLVTWGGNLLLMSPTCLYLRAASGSPLVDPELTTILAGFAATGLVLFGVGWLASSLLSSPTFAISVALPVPFAVAICLASCQDNVGYTREAFLHWYIGICTPLGLLGLIGGTWYYLRRIEP